MASKLFRLDSYDFLKGVLIAVLTPTLAKLLEALNTPGFDFFTYDWHRLLSLALAAGGSYLLKQFVTDDSGDLFGISLK